MDAIEQRLAKEKREREAKVQRKFIDSRNKKDIQVLLGLPEGRRFIRRILGHEGANYYGAEFNENSHRMAFNSGKRNVGMKVIGMLMDANGKSLMKLLTSEQEDS